MRDLTSYAYSFESLIRGNFLYVDKTEYIWQMIRPATAGYFLSRPRRFGKSLTVSTLKAVFEGKKELFKGLALYDKPYDWKPYPVIHLSFGDYGSVSDPFAELPKYLLAKIQKAASAHSIPLTESTPGLCLGELIDRLSVNGQIVILVDEYDKPILNNLDNPQITQIQKLLKGFFSVLKDRNDKERFLFVTGVSKFCHVSLFSELNNLTDLTMDARYATMFGYTQAELESSFGDRLEPIAERRGIPIDQLKEKIKNWYDGYRFEESATTVYNPVSIAKFFESDGKFNNYWFSTGTPEFLMKLIRENNFDFQNILSNPVPAVAFEAFEVDNIDPLSLLLQTGYLTIKSSIEKDDMPWFYLDFPNHEVNASFNTYLLNAYTRKSRRDITNFCQLLAESMKTGDIGQLRTVLEVFFSSISYEVHHKDESNFQNIFFTIFHLLGYDIKAESHTSCGRIDAVVQTDDWIYLFEFKLNKDDSALGQIKQKEYFKPFLLSPKRIMLIGANFDTETGKLSNWKNEELVRSQA